VPNMENGSMVIEPFFLLKTIKQPIPVPARTKASVCGSSVVGIAGSNPAVGMDVYCECCVLSGSGMCDEPITRPEESYRV
jgi:hypothetical protein